MSQAGRAKIRRSHFRVHPIHGPISSKQGPASWARSWARRRSRCGAAVPRSAHACLRTRLLSTVRLTLHSTLTRRHHHSTMHHAHTYLLARNCAHIACRHRCEHAHPHDPSSTLDAWCTAHTTHDYNLSDRPDPKRRDCAFLCPYMHGKGGSLLAPPARPAPLTPLASLG